MVLFSMDLFMLLEVLRALELFIADRAVVRLERGVDCSGRQVDARQQR